MPYVIEKMLKNLDKSMQLKCVIATQGSYRRVPAKQQKKEIESLYGYFNNIILNIYLNIKH